MSYKVDDVTDQYGTDMDINRSVQFENNIRELPNKYIERYINNFNVADIGNVVNEFGYVALNTGNESLLYGIGEDIKLTEHDMTFLNNKVFMPPVSMRNYKKALSLRILELYLAGQPNEVIDYVAQAVNNAERFETVNGINGVDIADISGWFSSIAKAVGGAVHTAVKTASNVVHTTVKTASNVAKQATHAVSKVANQAGKVVAKAVKTAVDVGKKVSKAALKVGKKVAGAVVAGIKYMADSLKKLAGKLKDAIMQKKKAKRELARWKQTIQNYDKSVKKGLKSKNPKKVALAAKHHNNVVKAMKDYNTAAKKLKLKDMELGKHEHAYRLAKQKAPVTALASVKNGQKLLKDKGLKVKSVKKGVKGLHGLDDWDNISIDENEGIGLPVAVVAAVAVAGIAIAIAAIIAMVMSHNKKTKKEEDTYEHEAAQYNETSGVDVVTTDYDPATDPVEDQIPYTDPVTGEQIMVTRYKNKIMIPKHKTGSSTRDYHTHTKTETTTTNTFTQIAKYGIMAAVGIGVLYVGAEVFKSMRAKKAA